MVFVYKEAMQQVSDELERLADEFWPQAIPAYKEFRGGIIPEDKALAVRDALYLGQEIKGKDFQKFQMLHELKDNRYWGSIQYWPDIKESLREDEEALYASVMIEQAKKGYPKGQKESTDYFWIVKQYDEGTLKKFISDELLEQAVNFGFWEFANNYFFQESRTFNDEEYNILLKYSEFLDLSRMNEFVENAEDLREQKRLNFCVTCEYLEAFERIKDKVDLELGTWLAWPIMDCIVSEALSWKDPKDAPDEFLEKNLAKYNEYRKTNLFQELIQQNIKYSINGFDMDDSWSVNNIEILKNYFSGSDEEFNELVSGQLDKTEVKGIIRYFPKKYLTEEALLTIKENIKKTIKLPDSSAIIPNLGFMQQAANEGFLDIGLAKEKITGELTSYLTNNRVSSSKVEKLVNTLNKDFVPEQLYIEVLHHSIGLLLKSKKTTSKAEELHNQGKKEGWLNEEQLSNNARKYFISDNTIQQKLIPS